MDMPKPADTISVPDVTPRDQLPQGQKRTHQRPGVAGVRYCLQKCALLLERVDTLPEGSRQPVGGPTMRAEETRLQYPTKGEERILESGTEVETTGSFLLRLLTDAPEIARDAIFSVPVPSLEVDAMPMSSTERSRVTGAVEPEHTMEDDSATARVPVDHSSPDFPIQEDYGGTARPCGEVQLSRGPSTHSGSMYILLNNSPSLRTSFSRGRGVMLQTVE